MVPVAFLFFNRPELTRRSFETIRAFRPDDLFLIANGPRHDQPDDADLCEQARAGSEDVDWPCSVHRFYADSNLGIRRRVSTGLDQVFSAADRAIIVEDDCIPNPDFFRFCTALLDRYQDEGNVMTITGDNFQSGIQRGSASYYFSRYPHVWGWATWRRAWELYDVDMDFWPSWRDSSDWHELFPGPVRRYWESIFDRVLGRSIDTWAYQLLATCLFHGGLTATPNANLVANIGFGSMATHTSDPKSSAIVPSSPLPQLSHPDEIVPDEAADLFTFRNHFRGGSWISRRAKALQQRLSQ